MQVNLAEMVHFGQPLFLPKGPPDLPGRREWIPEGHVTMAKDSFAKSPVKTILPKLAMIGLLVGLSACGTQGPLKPPSAAKGPEVGLPANPNATPAEEAEENAVKPVGDNFFLDPLL